VAELRRDPIAPQRWAVGVDGGARENEDDWCWLIVFVGCSLAFGNGLFFVAEATSTSVAARCLRCATSWYVGQVLEIMSCAM
jgi:hypothetical protein